MVRSLLLTFAMLLSAGAVFAQTTVLQGKVTDEATGEGLIGATVKVLKGVDFVRGTITDYEGGFRVAPLDPGTYNVEFSYTGFGTKRVEGVKVITNQITFLDQVMASNAQIDVVDVVAFKVPLIEQDKTQGGQTLTSDQIRNLPTRSVNAIVATTAGTTSIDGGAVNIKGSRSNATNYYIDGIRVAGSMPPVQDIEQLQVITGGLGAEYGDVTGGVISLITKGPASEYHGGIEVENSHGLDPYGWLLATANVSGPIWKKRFDDGSTRTAIGFRLSGQFLSQKDNGPPALPVYRAKEDVLQRLNAHPIYERSPQVYLNTAERLTQDSVDALDYRPDEQSRDIDITGKLDFRLTDNIDFSVTGTFKDVRDKFTPGGWRLLNSANNPTTYGLRYRGIARFRHRLGTSDPSGDGNTNRVSISNANYQLQLGFERGKGSTYDPRHEDRLFDYGYIGRFIYNPIPVFEPDTTGLPVHIDNNIQYQGFYAGYEKDGKIIIPNGGIDGNGNYFEQWGLNAYNEFADRSFDDPLAYTTFQATNGALAGFGSIWSGMHSSTGLVYNSFNKNESDILTITATAGFDLKLGRSGTHNIQFGLLNEQRTDRAWAISPFGLWNLARGAVDAHFTGGVDTNIVIGQFQDPTFGPLDIYANGVLTADELGENFENTFYKKLRESLGVNIYDYVNVDGLRPDQLSLDMFSARELFNDGYVGYYGYDYTGQKQTGNITFNDFFTSRRDGVRDFPVAPFRPVYTAGFIKDKFTFNKMIFSLGVRVERFDLNTKVMKDQYSLYEVISADDYFANYAQAGTRPGTIGDDFKVYVQGGQDFSPKAFRDGDTWYYADGRQANDANLIFGTGVVTPLLRDNVTGGDILDTLFNPETAFADYKPQVNVLPRLAFSFPISEDANFFAHYDVLVQRPPSNWQITPLDYINFYNPGRTPDNNANLRPERVVDYEVGFQQRLNQNSALKFSAYYREMRDMIQSRTILYVPEIGQYDTYGNIDYGTVKGFTVQYDLRRIRNTELRLAYTLQFADGTGSNPGSQRGLTARGNIRALFPLDFDERHNINAILDYRFSEGKRYNGPRIGGSDILSNFGINLQASAVSGRPYTAELRPLRFGGEGAVGSINGNRLPWRFTLDLRIDKSFNLAPAGKNPLNLNVYFRVANLLDRKNVIGVYTVTGSPTDDGYLATAEGQSIVSDLVTTGRSEEAYRASYSWVVRNPGNFTLPRRIYVGAVFEF